MPTSPTHLQFNSIICRQNRVSGIQQQRMLHCWPQHEAQHPLHQAMEHHIWRRFNRQKTFGFSQGIWRWHYSQVSTILPTIKYLEIRFLCFTMHLFPNIYTAPCCQSTSATAPPGLSHPISKRFYKYFLDAGALVTCPHTLPAPPPAPLAKTIDPSLPPPNITNGNWALFLGKSTPLRWQLYVLSHQKLNTFISTMLKTLLQLLNYLFAHHIAEPWNKLCQVSKCNQPQFMP